MQQRFIGYLDDLTQSNLLFMVKASSQPGVKSGYEASIDPNTLKLTIKPGYLILPDGMVVGETTPTTIQMVEPGLGDYWVTLIASRLIEPGMMNNEVRYEIVPNKVASDALSSISNRVRMPIAWIQKIEKEFRIINLGHRVSYESSKSLVPPFSEIYTEYPRIGYSDYLYRSFYDTDKTFYLKIPKEKDSYISSIHFTAKGNGASSLEVETQSGLKTEIQYGSSLATQILTYPAYKYEFEDTLKMKILSTNALNISEITINRTRLF